MILVGTDGVCLVKSDLWLVVLVNIVVETGAIVEQLPEKTVSVVEGVRWSKMGL